MYDLLISQLPHVLEGESDFISNCANFSAMLFNSMEDINWAGFYFAKDGGLRLGPFQGKPACVRIAWGKGVCGSAAAREETLVVPDVHAFPGHIACDAASRSEIVVPLLADGKVIGVLDIDSPSHGRFSEEDRAGLERLAGMLLSLSDIAGFRKWYC